MLTAKTEPTTSHLFFIALELPSLHLIYPKLIFGVQMERK